MKCIICHGEEIELAEVNEEIVSGNNIIFVPVKTNVCRTCGERYYDRRTMRLLEEAERKIGNHEAKLNEIGKILKYETVRDD